MKAKRNIDITFYIKELNYASNLHFRKMVGRDWTPANDPSFELTYDEVIEAIYGLVDKLDNGDRIKIEFDGGEVTKEILEKCLQNTIKNV